LGTIDPNTIIKMIGKSNEKTIEVGLLSVASKLYLEIVKAAFNWLAEWPIAGKYKYKIICFY
jgi:hypothetical protein